MLDEALNKCADNNNYTIYTSMCKAQRILMRSYSPVCSISGGSDSDIVLDLIHKVDEDGKVKYFWIDTGLNTPPLRSIWTSLNRNTVSPLSVSSPISLSRLALRSMVFLSCRNMFPIR